MFMLVTFCECINENGSALPYIILTYLYDKATIKYNTTKKTKK